MSHTAPAMNPLFILTAQPAFDPIFTNCWKVAERPGVLFFPAVSVQCNSAYFPPRMAAERLRGKGANGVALSKKCRITGASWWGDGKRNCARCADRGWRGERMGWEALEKKKGGSGEERRGKGRRHLNYLCSLWPLLSLCLSMPSERRGSSLQAHAQMQPVLLCSTRTRSYQNLNGVHTSRFATS